MRSRRRFPMASLLVASVLTLACSCASSIDTCTKLAQAFEGDLEAACKQPFGVRSGYCLTCAKNKLFSYQKQSGGACVCAPLTFTDSVCAAERDSGAATAAIVTADSECATYSLDRSDAGSDGSGGTSTTGGSGITGGTDPNGGGGSAGVGG